MTVLGTRFRLGSTSYVWPADILPNVRRLGPVVDDVELVLFEVDGHSNLPDGATIEELNGLAQQHQLTYTVHLPLDLSLTDGDSLHKAEKVIACTRALSPWAYVLHLDGRLVENSPSPDTLDRWRGDACRSLEVIAAMVDNPSRLCVENLENYPPELLFPVLDKVPVSLCVDVGHLWLRGRDPVSLLGAQLGRTRVIHLHGIGDRDHQSLLHQGMEGVAPVLDLLSRREYTGVLTLEVFSREDFFASRQLVAEAIDDRR
jgi:sugar phosphate isomerase/epimerase